MLQKYYIHYICTVYGLRLFVPMVDSKTKCNVLVFKSSRFKEESVNFASWIKEEASSAEEQLDQAIDSCTTLK